MTGNVKSEWLFPQFKTEEKIICCPVQAVLDRLEEGNKYVMFNDFIIINREIVNTV